MIAITIISSSSEKPQRRRAAERSAGRTKDNRDGSVGIWGKEPFVAFSPAAAPLCNAQFGGAPVR
jgi:hypothetical protein